MPAQLACRSLLACLAVAIAPAHAGEARERALPWSFAALELESVPRPREPLPDLGERIDARKSHWIPAGEIVAFDFLLNQWDRRHFGCCDFDSNIHSIRRNLRSGWVVDNDPFVVNQFGHPYQGSMYHGFARASGLDYWHGLAYTFLGSAFWEIAGETTPPSRNDQINTGIGGSFLGEALFRMANLALEHEGLTPFWREIAAGVISPPVAFNRAAFGERFRLVFPSRGPVYFTRMQLGASGSPRGDVGSSTATLHRGEALADFFMEYGLPGKKDYEYTRPFDYFAFQATASSANGFENVLTRGLLLGRAYEAGQSYRGIWGLYGHYDYIQPQTFRVSTTALSLGTTAQWTLTKVIELMGTVAGGVGYTAASTIRGADTNEFHYGLAPHALVALRLVFGDVAAIDVAGREWYVSRVAAAQRGGQENIARLDAALTVRVYKRHAISVKYLGNFRDARYPDIPDAIHQRRETIGLFYTVLGHDRFGAVSWQ
ncbi:MAG: DUF3943 domain-containing protein [Betaproteobacteria bacterium]